MNYLYGIIFKRISPMLNKIDDTATVFIDRNTDPDAQAALSNYLDLIPMLNRSGFPVRQGYAKPVFMEPKDDPLLQLADFVSGLTLRVFEDYKSVITPQCVVCTMNYCALSCQNINLTYPMSWKRMIQWNYGTVTAKNGGTLWRWKGLLWHPYGKNPKHIIVTK